MSSFSDHVQLMKSQENKYDSVFNKREWLYINDTTTQYDQGTSIIETTSLSNNSKFLDYNSAYLSVPLSVTLTSNASEITGIVKSSRVNTLPKAKSKTRRRQNKDMHKCSSVYSERGAPLPVLTSGGE
jgi:hypothetical protein